MALRFHAQSELAAMLTAGKEEQYLSGFWSMMTRGGRLCGGARGIERCDSVPPVLKAL
ncbi:hypothetical protein [Streptomyces broussonetiae]|uniref:Uncharacterized protein n=1 Tax=Streptomyces broussonetiae TaxID=2686304 RepID=A0A6I6N0R8_9ACTN|nr:hypothetical protein [Streptomyces broussonetiae]QHA02395.1 hypothetical protein GQF42_03005 [Streptomyces broussonetiae]